MSLVNLFYFLWTQHVSDINISIIRSLRLFCWITTLVVFFLVRCVLEFRCGWVGVVSVLQAEACKTDILMSETCWAHKKWNKIVSGIKLAFYSSTNCSVATRRNANTSHDYIPLTQMCINILKVKFHYIGLRSQSGYLLECLLLKSLSNITAPLKSKYISQHSAWWSVIVVVKKFRNLYKHETLYSFK